MPSGLIRCPILVPPAAPSFWSSRQPRKRSRGMESGKRGKCPYSQLLFPAAQKSQQPNCTHNWLFVCRRRRSATGRLAGRLAAFSGSATLFSSNFASMPRFVFPVWKAGKESGGEVQNRSKIGKQNWTPKKLDSQKMSHHTICLVAAARN
jgi:hypothetical protein